MKRKISHLEKRLEEIEEQFRILRRYIRGELVAEETLGGAPQLEFCGVDEIDEECEYGTVLNAYNEIEGALENLRFRYPLDARKELKKTYHQLRKKCETTHRQEEVVR